MLRLRLCGSWLFVAWLALGAALTLQAQEKPGVKPQPVEKKIQGVDSRRDPAPVVTAINREWSRALTEAKVPASPTADDAEFLRRAYLDLTGRISNYQQTTEFLASTAGDKRERLIDDLLASPFYGQHFGQRWRALILPRDPNSLKQQQDRLTPWLAQQFNANRAWSVIVSDLLTSEQEMYREPEASFMLANSDMGEPKPALLAAATGRLFLGVQISCAECHAHPFSSWTQQDFWGLAAFFGRVHKRSKMDSSLTEEPVGDTAPAAAAVKIPDGSGKAAGKLVSARLLDGTQPEFNSVKLRPALAAWVTSRDNPYFARAAVNRLWAHFLGRGLVHPVDDLREENPGSHPALLDLLAQEFNDSGHDLKHLVRCICRSDAYQRTSRPLPDNAADEKLFSHAAVKVLTPEVLYDSLQIVRYFRFSPTKPTNGKYVKPGAGVPSDQASREAFVRFFARSADVERGDRFEYGIPQLLRLLNDKEYNTPPPFLAELLAAETETAARLETIYLIALARRPTAAELERMTALVAGELHAEQAYAGVLWVLVNSGEFVLNR